jgi:hypothetical protein
MCKKILVFIEIYKKGHFLDIVVDFYSIFYAKNVIYSALSVKIWLIYALNVPKSNIYTKISAKMNAQKTITMNL